jgi:hypothetical protein
LREADTDVGLPKISLPKTRIRNLVVVQIALMAEVVRWDACSDGDDSLPGTATPSEECERHGLMTTGPRSDGADLIQIEVYDQIHLAPRVCEFFNAYQQTN